MRRVYPIQIVKFDRSMSVDKEPSFCWRILQFFEDRDRIVVTINSRAPRAIHKYSIELPISVSHAMELDQVNNMMQQTNR